MTATVGSVTRDLTALLEPLRAAVRGGGAAADTAERVAATVRGAHPTPEILTALQRTGAADCYVSRLLHADGEFSVVALVWRPGQATAVHDHLAWCVVAVLCGTEEETLYADRGDHLVEVGRAANVTGSVTAIVPPGDIHRVVNHSDAPAISLHVYGADLRSTGSSVRRVYDLPVLSS